MDNNIRDSHYDIIKLVRCIQLGGNMNKRKFATGEDYLLDETIDLVDEAFDVEEFENDPMFDPNDHEYLQEINNDEAEGQPLPLDRYFSRFGKGSKRNR